MYELAKQYADALVLYHKEMASQEMAQAANSTELRSYQYATRQAYNSMHALHDLLALATEHEASK